MLGCHAIASRAVQVHRYIGLRYESHQSTCSSGCSLGVCQIKETTAATATMPNSTHSTYGLSVNQGSFNSSVTRPVNMGNNTTAPRPSRAIKVALRIRLRGMSCCSGVGCGQSCRLTIQHPPPLSPPSHRLKKAPSRTPEPPHSHRINCRARPASVRSDLLDLHNGLTRPHQRSQWTLLNAMSCLSDSHSGVSSC